MLLDSREKVDVRSIHQLPPAYTCVEDGTHNLDMCPDLELKPKLLVYGMPLGPTEPPGQDSTQLLILETEARY